MAKNIVAEGVQCRLIITDADQLAIIFITDRSVYAVQASTSDKERYLQIVENYDKETMRLFRNELFKKYYDEETAGNAHYMEIFDDKQNVSPLIKGVEIKSLDSYTYIYVTLHTEVYKLHRRIRDYEKKLYCLLNETNGYLLSHQYLERLASRIFKKELTYAQYKSMSTSENTLVLLRKAEGGYMALYEDAERISNICGTRFVTRDGVRITTFDADRLGEYQQKILDRGFKLLTMDAKDIDNLPLDY